LGANVLNRVLSSIIDSAKGSEEAWLSSVILICMVSGSDKT
jgi:hypothetical protein